jgi:hypothetical protein
LQKPELQWDDVLNVELYPWHSHAFGRFKPTEQSIDLIRRYVLGPVAELQPRWVFAFGAPWFDVLTRLGFAKQVIVSTRRGDRWPGAPKDREIASFTISELTIVAERHQGSAGPPKDAEVVGLRDILAASKL